MKTSVKSWDTDQCLTVLFVSREQLSLYLQDTLKEVETLKENIKFQEEENSSANKQLDRVTKECEKQVYLFGENNLAVECWIMLLLKS